MTDITTIPIEELLDDLAESARDALVCELAIQSGIHEASGDLSPAYRMKRNNQIIQIIRAEIIRRQEAKNENRPAANNS